MTSLGWDPPSAFPPGTRKRRTHRSLTKRAFVEVPEEWHNFKREEGSPAQEADKTRPKKFRNLNTGRVYRKQDSGKPNAVHSRPPPPPRIKRRMRRNQSTAQDSGMDLSSPSGSGKAGRGKTPPSESFGRWRDIGVSPQPYGGIRPGNVFRPSRVLDPEALQWCDGRFLNKEPNFGLLERLLVIPEAQPDLDPSKMFNRSSGPTGGYKGRSMLQNLRRGGKKKTCMNKGIYVSKRYRKVRVVENNRRCIMGDPKTLNFLSHGDLMRVISALKACMNSGGAKEFSETTILLKILSDSRFDAIEANELGLDGLLTQLAQLEKNPGVVEVASRISQNMVQVLTGE
ncbi:hypothetical protein BSKO_05436 [Bryopsis sp. KO-2023]|nr:hypothetical protein BSKO_05436 [Bryopsis sp. KO-2023]